jgi:Flp pilus assembly protein TadG
MACDMAIAFSRIRTFGRSSAGSAAVEFAFVAPLLFLLLFAVVEFGRGWWAKSSLQYAAERAARFAVVCNGGCPGDGAVVTYATNQVYDQTVPAGTFTVSHPTANQTCVNYTFSFAPWFTGDLDIVESTLSFQGTSCRAHT